MHKKLNILLFLLCCFLLASCSLEDLIISNSTKFSSDVISSENFESSSSFESSSGDNGTENVVTYDDLQIHFLELGAYNTGDSTYIKAGDIDILIDAGSTQRSAATIIEYVNQYCLDGKLEYVITTHSHSDHYTGMFGNSSKTKDFFGNDVNRTGIMYYYQIDTIIDFSFTTKNTENPTGEYKSYIEAVDYAITKGAKHYTAGECFNNENGASSTYVLDEAKNITMDILYNKYYFEKSSDENNHSVCTMINYNDHHFMLTGDLEKEGEESMAAYYDKSTPEKTLPHVDLFKAGHHGSASSSNDCLLSLITPDICCVCCCAGSSEYTNDNLNVFPTQEFINRIAKYTDRVYVTSYEDYDESRKAGTHIFKSLNGNICISCNGTDVGVNASNNTIKLKDTDWFNEEIYVIKTNKGVNTICSAKAKSDYYDENTEGVEIIKRRIWPTYN